jgi:hypothetical protein
MSARLLLIVPRDQATKFQSLAAELADMPGGEVIVDRRVAERRSGNSARQGDERRQGDRRSGGLERPGVRVLFVH